MFILLIETVRAGFHSAETSVQIVPQSLVIGNPEIHLTDHAAREFTSLSASKPYIRSILNSQQAENAIKKLQFSTKISIDMNSMSGNSQISGSNNRLFERNHVLFCASKKSNGRITLNFVNLDINVRALSEQIVYTTTKEKWLWGLIKGKTTTTSRKELRTLSATEVSNVFTKMNNAASSKLQNAIKKAKSIFS